LINDFLLIPLALFVHFFSLWLHDRVVTSIHEVVFHRMTKLLHLLGVSGEKKKKTHTHTQHTKKRIKGISIVEHADF
jgi:hypothetical protein